MSKRTKFLLGIGVIATVVFGLQLAAYAFEAALSGSKFEIDNNANLKHDAPAADATTDWADLAHPNGPEFRSTDVATGSQDDSYKGGVKETTVCPGETTGSIPNNKSDLLTFHVYEEEGSTPGDPGFMNLAWSRVSDPSGTTLMDFEFNQADVDDPADACPQGPNVKRTDGDLLIEYEIDQGGARANVFGRFWNGTTNTWGPRQDLSQGTACNGGPCAVGTINNTSALNGADTDGLGPKALRTFGEAQIDLDLLQSSDGCTSFGSGMAKSRSSDADKSQLKDFIRPLGIDVGTCGTVKVVKDDAANGTKLAGAEFDLRENNDPAAAPPGNEDTVVDSCTTAANGECEFGSVQAGAYWVVETKAPAGYDLPATPYQAVTVTADQTATVTFHDPAQKGAIQITKLRKHAASGTGNHPHSGVTFTINDGIAGNTDPTATTGADGKACVDNLALGTYSVEESVPAGYKSDATGTPPAKSVTVNNAATCAATPYAGETVQFTNTPLTDITVSVNSLVDGGTASTIDCDAAADPPFDKSVPATSPDNGDGSFTLSNKEPGTYTCTIVVDP